MKFHAVADIFPMMSPAEFRELKEDIAKNGLLEPIWTYKNQIIDGRNRYLACKEIGVDPVYIEWRSVNGTSLIDFVLSLNLKRRHLNASQKAMVAVDALPFFEEQAHKRKLSTLKKGINTPVGELVPHREKGRSRDIVAKQFGVSGRYIQTAKTIAEKLPELADQIRKGEATITQGKVKIKRLERVAAFKEAGRDFKSDSHTKIIHADFFKWCNDNLEDNSVDLILADPPYGVEYLDLYSQLGEIAKRVLKPSKWLIVYCNVKFIPEATALLNQYLTYWWMMCLTYKGKVKMKYSTFNSFRPVLLYHKQPPKLPKLLNDHFECDNREKDLHDWQQAQEPIRYIIERFTGAGDMVLDPMAGAGTVLKVCKDLRRKCIAIDRDSECVEIMKGRLKL
jgi:hypothetical protein